jgi:hypothetical protein
VKDITAIRHRAFFELQPPRWPGVVAGALDAIGLIRSLGRQTATGPVPRHAADFSRRGSPASLRADARRARASQFLSLCSPDAARSKYVNEEIRHFKSMGRTIACPGHHRW